MPSVIQELSDEDVALNRDHVVERVEDWKRRISHLYDEIVSWFPDLRSDRDDTVEMFEALMHATGVAPSALPVLRLHDSNGQVAKFIPKGLWIIGSNGLMILFSGKGQYVIADRSDYFAAPRWEISSSSDRLRSEPLSRTTLGHAIR
ncbi:hypothetical protein [uncultured Methylobacterium sp.]|uniref:hypothetical protein n=1 Tax=uncultured Methylobacterium sp. TaxID=157278 RepID=UPI0026358F3E|nr:hypothetical protein [uncultured Methylobacterium sp.]